MAARPDAPPGGARPVTVTAPAHRAGLATISAGYLGYALVRLASHAGRHAAFAHAAQLWQAERRMHLRIEPWLNRLAAAHPPLAEAAGYYQPAPHELLAKVRDPGALPHLRPLAGPGWARSGTRQTDAARSREPKALATACPASRGCPKPGDTDGTDRSVVRGGR